MTYYELYHWMTALREDYAYRPNIYTAQSYQKIDTLFSLLKQIKPNGDDEYRLLYLKVPHGTEEEYRKWLEEEQEYDKDDIDFYTEGYMDGATDEDWIVCTASEYINPEKEVYRSLSLNYSPCIRVEPNDKNFYPGNEWDIEPLVDWLISAVKDCIEALANGTYNYEVLKSLPYEMRTGKINRNVLWTLFPEMKQNYFALMSEENQKRFCSFWNMKKIPDERVEMTKSLYLKACAALYRVNKMRGYEEDDWALFCHHSCSHGRLEGLANIDDSPEAFANWMETADKQDWGGHAWAIKDGSSRSRIMLKPVKDEKGWYLALWGGELYSTVEVANGYLAMCDAGIPVSLPEYPEMRKKICGQDSVGIVPENIMPVHCYDLFPDERVLSFLNMSDLEMKDKAKEAFICQSIWYAPGYTELVDATED